MSGSGRSELCDPMAQVIQTILQKQLFPLHYNKISILFSQKRKLRGLGPNFHIHVTV